MSQPVLFAIEHDAGVVRAPRDDLTRRLGDGATVVRLAHEYLTAPAWRAGGMGDSP